MPEIKTILPTDIRFTHKGQNLVAGFRQDSVEEDELAAILGLDMGNDTLDQKYIYRRTKNHIGTPQQWAEGYGVPFINRILVDHYGGFDDVSPPVEVWWLPYATFFHDNYRFDPAAGFVTI
ncbi:hypothetical protein S140_169 [Shewanella sp. phage 1/40]|uniref:hypothetical protein n=1 Tax=Shewanella sp. phage 1/40 TaxID=1458860 RepID=UPI0004F723DC|nr:hypothetical protein S140_169 [Shewanella sp. phage 1/40]AHK11576.1 hypothetical protein S140_169 [Shewanella sp. phage 1/40]